MRRALGLAAVSYTHLDVYKRQSDLHADIPRAPDDGAQVANGNAAAHAVDLLVVLAADRSRDEACLLYTSRCV